jgi:precorrin-4/cobalt-precorrin-4 C11-methyltransferase
MAIFLSSGMTEALQARLIRGGYREDTPAAIVYKASWPEEKTLRCTVGSLSETAEQNNILNHALILVGGFLGEGYNRSKLYDPAFTTGFRRASEP